MLNRNQIKLVQTAVRAAGLRGKGFEGRYRFLLSQYRQPSGRPVKSCRQLNNLQLDDLLAICESLGFRRPGKPEDFYRKRAEQQQIRCSIAQTKAIQYLAGDLGWADLHLAGFIGAMTKGAQNDQFSLSSAQACDIIEGLKAILGRKVGKQYSNVKEIQDEFAGATDGQKSQV